MIETDIKQALFDHVSMNVAGTTDWLANGVSFRVEFPDLTFTVPESDEKRYLNVKHFPAPTTNYDLADDSQTHSGTLQITLVDPNQLGELQASEITSQIVARFAKDTELRSGDAVVKIPQTPAVLGSIVDGQRTLYPVSIRYRCST